jgi:hypothetical protein
VAAELAAADNGSLRRDSIDASHKFTAAKSASAAVYDFRAPPGSVTAGATLTENYKHSSACRFVTRA